MSHDSTELLPSLQVIFADKLIGVGLLENLKNGGVYSKKKVKISGIMNFVSGFRLELMYIYHIENIRSSLIHLHGFQLLVLLP